MYRLLIVEDEKSEKQASEVVSWRYLPVAPQTLNSSNHNSGDENKAFQQHFLHKKTNLVALLSVPRKSSIDEILRFGESNLKSLTGSAFISNPNSKQVTCLLKFRTLELAVKYVRKAHGNVFSNDSVEKNTCIALYLTEDNFIQDASNPIPFIWSALPSCPRCLDRLDSSVSGIVSCRLSNWKDVKCEICSTSLKVQKLIAERESLKQQGSSIPQKELKGSNETPQPKINEEIISPTFSDLLSCETCGAKGSFEPQKGMWICLVCGYVGCGRYEQSHMVDHYQSAGHRFTLDIHNQVIWDYEGDGYVHRLVKFWSENDCVQDFQMISTEFAFHEHEGDGMVVDNNDDDEDDDPYIEEQHEMVNIKLQSIASYYNSLLNSQLEQQYQYFENKIAETDKKLNEQFNSVKERTEKLKNSNEHTQSLINALDNKRKILLKKHNQVLCKVKKANEDKQFLSDLNLNLVENRRTSYKELESQKKENHKQQLEKLIREKSKKLQNLEADVAKLMKEVSKSLS